MFRSAFFLFVGRILFLLLSPPLLLFYPCRCALLHHSHFVWLFLFFGLPYYYSLSHRGTSFLLRVYTITMLFRTHVFLNFYFLTVPPACVQCVRLGHLLPPSFCLPYFFPSSSNSHISEYIALFWLACSSFDIFQRTLSSLTSVPPCC